MRLDVRAHLAWVHCRAAALTFLWTERVQLKKEVRHFFCEKKNTRRFFLMEKESHSFFNEKISTFLFMKKKMTRASLEKKTRITFFLTGTEDEARIGTWLHGFFCLRLKQVYCTRIFKLTPAGSW